MNTPSLRLEESNANLTANFYIDRDIPGGIGLQLSEQIRTLEWQTVCFIIIMILVTVSAIDMLSTRIRIALIGKSVPPV